MLQVRCLIGVALVAGFHGPTMAGGPVLLGKTEAELSGTLRGLLLDHLPTPLYDKAVDWDKTKQVERLTFRRGKFTKVTKTVNDGLWKKFHADALNPKDSLILDLREVSNPSATAVRFTLFVAGDVRCQAWQEQWESGVKLYGVSVRGRARVRVTLSCEANLRMEMVSGLPEIVCSVKVLSCEVGYENLVCEHVAGLGGEAAKAIGATAQTLIHQWKPSIERDLLAKANRAVTKAIERKEVRVGLSKLLKQPPKP